MVTLQECFDEEEAKMFFHDLQYSRCVSGMINSLGYYVDTIAFYDDFEVEFEALLEEISENMKFNNRFETLTSLHGAENVGNIKQEKNLLAWFGFEETAHQLA